MRFVFFIFLLLIPSYATCLEKADFVLVIKSESKLYLKKNGKTLKEFHVVFGDNPKGHKLKEGDEKIAIFTNQFIFPIRMSKISDMPKN
jgi:hypothetical protein